MRHRNQRHGRAPRQIRDTNRRETRAYRRARRTPLSRRRRRERPAALSPVSPASIAHPSVCLCRPLSLSLVAHGTPQHVLTRRAQRCTRISLLSLKSLSLSWSRQARRDGPRKARAGGDTPPVAAPPHAGRTSQPSLACSPRRGKRRPPKDQTRTQHARHQQHARPHAHNRSESATRARGAAALTCGQPHCVRRPAAAPSSRPEQRAPVRASRARARAALQQPIPTPQNRDGAAAPRRACKAGQLTTQTTPPPPALGADSRARHRHVRRSASDESRLPPPSPSPPLPPRRGRATGAGGSGPRRGRRRVAVAAAAAAAATAAAAALTLAALAALAPLPSRRACGQSDRSPPLAVAARPAPPAPRARPRRALAATHADLAAALVVTRVDTILGGLGEQPRRHSPP